MCHDGDNVEPMTERVEVCGTARLHLGFLDLNFAMGRRFGSIGMALDAPCTRVVLQRAREDAVHGPDASRAARYMATMLRACGVQAGHALTVAEAIPAHGGLGSGTQLALAVATAVRRLHGLAPALRADAALLERGVRSGIGVALFEQGGLVVDGGRGAREELPPLLARLDVPAEWRVLLVLDPARQGLSGAREAEAFARLPPLAAGLAAETCRQVLIGALPAVAEDDLVAFGAAIARIQEIAGDHFAPAQGGRFTSARVTAALDALREAGATGIGQSSWGPTGFAFMQGEAAARASLARMQASGVSDGLDIRICRALNRGATINAA
jgi:beta-RFAP synthase